MADRDALAVLLTNLQSPNNDVRSHAEHVLATDWVGGGIEPRATLLLGLTELATAGEPQYRPFAAVLLRRYAIKISPDRARLERLFDSLPPQVRQQIRAHLLAAFVADDQPRDTRTKLADALAEVARPPMNTGADDEPKVGDEWPELLPTLFQATKSPHDSVREGVFRIFAAVPELVTGRAELVDGAVKTLEAGFADSAETVRIAAVNAFTAFFERLPKSTWRLFKPILPSLLGVAEPLRQAGKATELTAVFESLIDLAALAPKMFQNMFMDVINFSLAVADDKDLDEATRLSGLEFAVTFADEAPNMCKEHPEYADKMVVQCLSMLLEVGEDDDDAAEWNQQDDYATVDDEEVHNAAKSAIDRLSLQLEGEVMVPPLFRWLPKMFESAAWRERHGALMAISNAAEGCRDVMITELDRLFDMVLPHLQDPHSRVQWAACNAVGQMSTDFADVVQRKYAARVLPPLIAKLSQDSTFRVQTHAAAAVLNFSERATRDIIDPYLDDMLGRLLLLLQGPKRYVQEQVLTTIAIVADAAKSKFIKYYDTLMPLLLNVMKADTGPEYRILKAKSIECSTLIAVAVGKEKFAPQFEDLVQIFTLVQEQAPPDDPCRQFLIQAWARLCRIMGSDFFPYLQEAMPSLLAVAKLSADYQILDQEQASQYEAQDGWEVYEAAGQYIAINTSLFEDKENAIELIRVYASELGGDFFPWVEDIVTHIVVPALGFYYSEGVQFAACDLIPHLVASTQQAAIHRRGGESGKSDATVLNIWNLVFAKLMSIFFMKLETLTPREDINTGISSAVFATMSQCIDMIGAPAVPDAVVTPMMASVGNSMEALRERVQAREFEENDDFIEHNVEDDDEEDDEELLEATNKLIHSLFRSLKAGFVPHFEKLLPVLGAFINSSNDSCLEWALFVVGDLIEYAGPASWKYHEVFGSRLLESLVHANSRIRQAAAYGIGVAAQHGGEPFAQPAVQSLESLFRIVNSPDSRSDDNLVATETAVTSIAKILRTRGALLGDQLTLALTEWVKTLPIVDDAESAPFAYLFLADLMDQRHAAVTAQVQKTFYSVAEALVAQALTGRAADRVVAATKSFLGQLPSEQTSTLLDGLSPDDREIVQSIFQ